jgi:hypothetical protein
MLRELKTFPLLDGYHGRPRADLSAVRDLVVRVGALVAAHPAVAELDLNPVIATPDGALVVNARVRIDAPGPAATFPSLNAGGCLIGAPGCLGGDCHRWAFSRASSRSRSSNLGILPVEVLGNASMNSTALGALKWARLDRT